MGFRLKVLDNTFNKLGMLPGMYDCDVECEPQIKVTQVPKDVADKIISNITEAIETAGTAVQEFNEAAEKIKPFLPEIATDDIELEEIEDNSNEDSEDGYSNNTIIKNISFSQTEILQNIMTLHNNGKPFECDITASTLKFYLDKNGKERIPLPKYLFDVYPMDERIQKITPFERLPFEDNTLQSIVCDLPFVISPKKCKSVVEKKEGANMISSRFSSFYPMEELIENIYWWIKECYRVLKKDGILVWKMQSTVSGGRQVWAAPFSFLVADKMGFYVVDEFILEAKARLIPGKEKMNKQQHARKYTSTFWVFVKDSKKYKVNSPLNLLKRCEETVFEGKKWEVK